MARRRISRAPTPTRSPPSCSRSPGSPASRRGTPVAWSRWPASSGSTSWLAAGMTNLKIAEGLGGDADAIATIEYCLGAWRAAGASSNLTQFGLGLALAYRAVGRTTDALTTIDQALRDAADTEERYLAPELHRVRGDLLERARARGRCGRAALDRRWPPPPTAARARRAAGPAVVAPCRRPRRRARQPRRDRSAPRPSWTRRAPTPNRSWRTLARSWNARPRGERRAAADARAPAVGRDVDAAPSGLRRARRRDRLPASRPTRTTRACTASSSTRAASASTPGASAA